MITTATVYVTSDNCHFFSPAEAEAHEQLIKKERELNEVVNALSKSEQIRNSMKKAILAWEARA
jgi:hypothetical protein